MQSGCQVDCHVSHRDGLLWASGCFGVYIKRTGCEHENSTPFPPIYPIFCLSYTPCFLFLLLLGFLFRLTPMRGLHPRCDSRTSELGRRGGVLGGTPWRRMTDPREATEGRKWRRKVATSLKDTSLKIALREMTADHYTGSRAEDPGKPHTSFSRGTQEMCHFHLPRAQVRFLHFCSNPADCYNSLALMCCS